jgi:hypothetical protein
MEQATSTYDLLARIERGDGRTTGTEQRGRRAVALQGDQAIPGYPEIR